MNLMTIGFCFAIFFFALSFIISKMGRLPIYWISLCANTGFFLAFLLVGRAFPDDSQIALFLFESRYLGLCTYSSCSWFGALAPKENSHSVKRSLMPL
ncbi:hypothetical protein PRIP_05968 [Listeria riparia FSL S10-1204]|uniref:Uncharacterized protein n=2 Tax=Listeria riparia TaxID=1494964 RepID=W7D8A8_9LIST|nr:hypothetical protein PRIP_05968 [Listeria riparia FSL S10-1204]